ncbi:MAG: thioredoxin domain-containing protein [Patulibacter minatonensis]
MANALAASSSPYLRQHAENPVDWVPWSEEALERAAALDKPLLISVGYSACHWCHVMAHESFEDPAVAAVMNEHFVCIKVDREERPDIDAIYMDACQMMTGHGGWPLNAFATPDGRPFFTGTYFPPEPSRGMPGWRQVLEALAEAWRERRDEIEEQGTMLTERLSGAAGVEPGELPGSDALAAAVVGLRQRYDSVHGGFGEAPKFPPSTVLGFLLRRGELPMARQTLSSMASGGIFDQVAGGFARYAVDQSWTVPHFEKMLSDNALLGRRYAEAAVATGDGSFGRIAERTLDWVLADLADADGGFASAFDADSGGEEGTFYVWTAEELRQALGDEDADAALDWFGITPGGNFDGGSSVLEVRGVEPPAEQADRIRARLLEVRAAREAPARDDKRIVSWNALAVAALATSGALLGRADHTAAAVRCAELILARARTAEGGGRLLRLIPVEGEGPEGVPSGVLDDHAHLLEALVALYEATFEPRWLDAATALADVLLRDFVDPERGGFFTTADDHERLIARRKDLDDSPLPSGQASAALGLLRLHALTGDEDLLTAAEDVLRIGARFATEHPAGFGTLLSALQQYLEAPREIAIVGRGPAADALLAVAREVGGAHAVIAASAEPTDDVPLLAGRDLVNGDPAAYVCWKMACRAPITDPDALRVELTA